ncbi:hypothetical protein [Rhodobaculum claviforme]|uniref:hypothetical protein n=1 Tax=Rhodobaculum claviforme TaxID=1549854 RepID=UPI0019149030|nr:hypothetical protein [Rhodobaculum claviforme]
MAFLEIEDGVRPRDAAGIDAQITRARAFAEWVKTEERRGENRPSQALEDYAGAEAPPRVALYRNTADEILHTLPEGSLIFVPNPDLTRNGMFGELVAPDAPRIRFRGAGHRSEFSYLGRRLKNVKNLPMQNLDPDFFRPMRKRVWTHEYAARETELLYRQYYGDFEIIGRKAVAEIEVTRRRVSGTDLNIIGALTTLVDETLARVERGDREQLTMHNVVFMQPDPQGPVLHANIGSPGSVLVESVTRRVAPVVKVIMVLALAGYVGADVWDMVQARNLVLENTDGLAGVADAQLAETHEKTYAFVRASGADSLDEILEYVRDFHARTGGRVDGHVHHNE